MTRFVSYPEEAVREALRRETQENMAKDLVLFEGQWLTRPDYRLARRRAVGRTLRHTIELSVLIVILALVGLGFLALINLII